MSAPTTTPATVPAAPDSGAAFGWTPAQRDAIQERRGEVVVSASAGSGKTAVLTERVLRLVTERDAETGSAPIPLDRLLIITFTEKATRQMRERIEVAVRRRLEQQEENAELRDALDKLPDAWILTIDAFCRRVVMENFHQVGLAPNARIPAEAEAAELELRVLRELLDRRARESPTARAELEMLLRCENGRADNLIAQLRGLLGFLASLDRPEAWLREQRERLRLTQGAADFSELPEAIGARATFVQETNELADAFENVMAQAHACFPADCIPREWASLLGLLRSVAAAPPPFAPARFREQLAPAAGKLDKLHLKRECGAVLFAEKSFCKEVLERFSDFYADWHRRWLARDEALWLRGAQLAATRLLALLGLAEAAEASLAAHKRRRGLVSFSDFERLALELLGADPAEGPTAVAYELQSRFEYVLVDEYQDTSPLQDAIVARVSRDGSNLFLVGDVKQSIYRFRHAEPALFKQRIDKARAAGAGGGVYGIDLLENFRSRPAVLEFVNAIFARLMDEAVGELTYGARERLIAGRAGDTGLNPVCVEIQWLPKTAQSLLHGATLLNFPDPLDQSDSSDPTDDLNTRPAEADALEQLAGIEAQAAWVAQRLAELTHPTTGQLIPGEERAPPRRAQLGDCAILLRGVAHELEVWLRALSHAGLRVRAPGIDPLFTAPELVDLLNALRVADNPFQDFPLAALLRSPLFDFTPEELLRIRLSERHGHFHAAFLHAVTHSNDNSEKASVTFPLELINKAAAAWATINNWRWLAQTRPAEAVLENILADTGYEAYLTGQNDAMQRLERVDYLRGLLRRLGRGEAGSARGQHGLSVFLELVDRAEEESGNVGDLPESLAGTDDAVNLLTIHKSKGLEFPIVILPRLERNFRDPARLELLFDLHGGLGAKGIDIEHRQRFATLAHERLASLRRRKERSEELRLLYVAMTRARERLILLGQMRNLDQARARWQASAPLAAAEQPLGALARLRAACPAELIGPIAEALAPPSHVRPWLSLAYAETLPSAPPVTAQRPTILRALAQVEPDPAAARRAAADELDREAAALEQVPVNKVVMSKPRLLPRFEPTPEFTHLAAKTTVTALRSALGSPASDPESTAPAAEQWREEQTFENEEEARRPIYSPATSLAGIAPDFALAGAGLTTIEAQMRGTLHHQLLALLDLRGDVSEAGLRAQAERLISAGLLTGASREQILATLDLPALAWLFTTDLAEALLNRASSVLRELPFTVRRPAAEFADAVPTHSHVPLPSDEDFVLVQGMIDLVLDFGDSALIVDYKTDAIFRDGQIEELTARYRLQLELYAEALRSIWGLRQVNAWLIFLDARGIVSVL